MQVVIMAAGNIINSANSVQLRHFGEVDFEI